MSDSLPTNRRIYGVLKEDASGRAILQLTALEPDSANAMAILLWRGEIADGLVADLPIVTDPSLDPTLRGPDGSNGWTPVLVAEGDGTRTLMRVADWQRLPGEPPSGCLSDTGLTDSKASAFNFNAVKRVRAFSAVTNSSGIATISFGLTPPFAVPPQIIVLPASPNVVLGGHRSTEVAGSRSATGVQVKVDGSALLSSVVTPITGATANVIAIEL